MMRWSRMGIPRKVNWGIRGKNAADLALGYRVEV